MQVDLVDNIADLDALRGDWQAVYEADPEANYFLSWTWMSGWLRRLRTPWLVMVARPSPGAAPAALFPIQIGVETTTSGAFYNSIRMAGQYLAGYCGFLCRPEAEAAALPAFATALQSLNWAVLHLVAINSSPGRLALFLGALPDSEFAHEARPRIDARDQGNYSIYPRLRLPDSMDAYLAAAMGPATRKNARSGLRRIDSGDFRVTHADAATLEHHLDELMRLWAVKWAPIKGETASRGQADDHRAMLRRAFAAGDALIALLWHGGQMIAGQGSLLDRKQNSVLCLVGSRDLSIRKPAPGFLLHLHCIRWAIGQRFAVYDMQQGDHVYKYDFGPEEHVIEAHVVTTRSRQNLRGTLEPRSLDAVFARTRALAATGQAEQATVGCRQILQADPAHIGARALAAQLAGTGADERLDEAGRLLRAGRAAEAQRLLAPLAQSGAGDFNVRHLLGVALLMRRDHAAALGHLDAAIRIRPSVPAAHNHRGQCLLAMGKASAALAAFERALALAPGHSGAQENRKRALALVAGTRSKPFPAAAGAGPP